MPDDEADFIECIAEPRSYTSEQIKFCVRFVEELARGRFILTAEPEGCEHCLCRPATFCVECGRVAAD